MVWAAVFISALAGGALQTAVGFGAGVIIMLVMQCFLSMTAAPALTASVCMLLSLTLSWKLRRHIQFRICILPMLVCQVVSMAAISLVRGIDLSTLKTLFGLLLIMLALYSFFLSQRFSLRPTMGASLLCSTASGIGQGLFSVAGPPMAVFYLAASSGAESYVANMQFTFALCCVINTVQRFLSGLYTPDLLPLTAVGMVGILVGERLGMAILSRLNTERLKKLVYSMVAVSGVVILCQQLFS